MTDISTRLATLALSIMSSVDQKAEKERQWLERKLNWCYDRQNKVWWALKDYKHEPSQFFNDDYPGTHLVMLITDAEDPKNVTEKWMSGAYEGVYVLRPNFKLQAAIKQFWEDAMAYYRKNSHAFYTRYWRVEGEKPPEFYDGKKFSDITYDEPGQWKEPISATVGEPFTFVLTREHHMRK